MADETKIEWTDHTFNPWWGCSRVSAACRSCYADALATRYGKNLWRRNGDRMITSPANWRKPLKWNRDAERAGVPAKVFCASMGDVFEAHPALDEPRKQLWRLIESTPWLHWQLLTKRPENAAGMVPAEWADGWPTNAWVGATVESPRFMDERLTTLAALPAHVRFLSCEPLLADMDLRPWLWAGAVSWVIVGGETGRNARPMEVAWAESIVEQCREVGVSVLVKQLGTATGGKWHQDIETFPPSLRVREYPAVPAVAS